MRVHPVFGEILFPPFRRRTSDSPVLFSSSSYPCLVSRVRRVIVGCKCGAQRQSKHMPPRGSEQEEETGVDLYKAVSLLYV